MSAPATPAADRKPSPLLKLGLRSDLDLCLHLPLRYEDETQLTPIGSVQPGTAVQVEGTVQSSDIVFRPRRQLVVTLTDGTGLMVLRFFNFYGSQQKALAVGARVRARGEARYGHHVLEIVHPSFNAVEPGTPLKQALTPVYPSAAGISQAYLRKAIANALQRTALPETLPAPLLRALAMPTLAQALAVLHHPGPDEPLGPLQDRTHPAWLRLKIEELVAQQLSHTQARRARASRRAPRLMPARAATPALTQRLLEALPFALTPAQQRCVAEITADLQHTQPMHRLLQGDVGSGKTVVAALAAAHCIDAGYQCALMAPTEILAEQHLRKLVQWLQPLGVQVAWLTGSLRAADKRAAQAAVASGEAALVVGTHAVIQERVQFARLGLAIVDEQHRFGVGQRLALRHKGSTAQLPGASKKESADTPIYDAAPGAVLEPHQLMMTATPIPRTLAMTYFADLDLSVIDAQPPGRSPIVTKVFGDDKRDEVLARIHEQVTRGRQVYWVCPLVEESEALDLQNATAVHQELCALLAPALVVLLHGRMSADEKQAAMGLFADGTAVVMVATTVIEVGVDVPNASLMVVEHAERFGLSQLHQLRGRVGRGAQASVCLLLYSGPLSATGRERLRAMRDTQDGFVIAQRDLELRGPGEMLGA
ncbi:MAG: ATP-dependent DNA helicase RecG, partial [Betaproteobacteria bacterium]|nr:ATP-dependent DNA helicase RecG [Betaproteobacteria bacterium]